MNQQDDFSTALIYISHDLLDQNTHDPLLQPHIGRRRVPNSGQILCQAQKKFLAGQRRILGIDIELLKLLFQFACFLQSNVPSCLKLRRN